jgi:hypothetical protein
MPTASELKARLDAERIERQRREAEERERELATLREIEQLEEAERRAEEERRRAEEEKKRLADEARAQARREAEERRKKVPEVVLPARKAASPKKAVAGRSATVEMTDDEDDGACYFCRHRGWACERPRYVIESGHFIFCLLTFLSAGRACKSCASLKRRCGMSKTESDKQTGKRKRTDVEEDEEHVRVTRNMAAEPEWVGKVLERIDGLTERVGSFTERVEAFERRLKDKDGVERKWRKKVVEQLEMLEDYAMWEVEGVKKSLRKLTGLSHTLEALTETVETMGDGNKWEEMDEEVQEVVVPETEMTVEGDGEEVAEKTVKNTEEDEEDAGEAEETLRDADGDPDVNMAE